MGIMGCIGCIFGGGTGGIGGIRFGCTGEALVDAKTGGVVIFGDGETGGDEIDDADEIESDTDVTRDGRTDPIVAELIRVVPDGSIRIADATRPAELIRPAMGPR